MALMRKRLIASPGAPFDRQLAKKRLRVLTKEGPGRLRDRMPLLKTALNVPLFRKRWGTPALTYLYNGPL